MAQYGTRQPGMALPHDLMSGVGTMELFVVATKMGQQGDSIAELGGRLELVMTSIVSARKPHFLTKSVLIGPQKIGEIRIWNDRYIIWQTQKSENFDNFREPPISLSRTVSQSGQISFFLDTAWSGGRT